MNSSQKLLGTLLLLGAALCMPHIARAATSCTVTATALNFGSYSPIPWPPGTLTNTATLTVSCSGAGHTNHAVTILLDAGTYGTFASRKMQNGNATDSLTYNLYASASYVSTNIWGDGTSGTLTQTVTTGKTNPAATATATVYGQVDANQDVTGLCPTTPCGYTDSVGITINF